MEESLRMIERILGILLGGFFAWLGYRLFLDVSSKQTSSGEFKLPSGIAIHLTRIGPGIFFALFGAAVVCYSIVTKVTVNRSQDHTEIVGTKAAANPISYKEGSAEIPTSSKRETITKNFTGIEGQTASPPQELLLKRNEYRNYLKFLNNLGGHLEEAPKAVEIRDFNNIFPQLKLALLELAWGQDWGSWSTFENWVNTGANYSQLPKDAVKEPYEYFNAR